MFSLFRKAATPTIRPIRPSAAVDCARLHAASFAHPWSAAEFENLLAAGNIIGDGALARGASLIGFALSRHAAGEAEILSVAVAKSERGKGIGRALMNAHLARLAAAGQGPLRQARREDVRRSGSTPSASARATTVKPADPPRPR